MTKRRLQRAPRCVYVSRATMVRADGRHTGGVDSAKLVSPHRRVSSRRVVAGNRLGALCGRASLPRSICGCKARAAGVVVDARDLPVFQILGHPTSPNSTRYLGPECQSAICCSGVFGSRDPAGLLAELRNMHVLHVVP